MAASPFVKKGVLFAALWGLLVTGFAVQAYVAYAMRGNQPSLLPLLSWEGSSWALWGILAPAIFWFTRKYPLDRDRKQYHLAFYVMAAVLFSLVHLFLNVALDSTAMSLVIEPYGNFTEALQANFFSRITWRIFVFAAIVVACHGYEAQRKYRNEERKASELKVQLMQAQLQALKMQIQPHFLFNTLHSLSELIHRDVRAADELVVRLGDFLRMTLQNSNDDRVPLSKELEFLRRYLEIEHVRLQDRLEVLFDIDPGTVNHAVPNLLLQPIVENAIRHGISPRSGPGTVQIRAKRVASMLRIEVQDNGPGYYEAKGSEFFFQSGLGLANTRERLQKMYGTNQRIQIQNVESGGFLVSLEIPAEEANPREKSDK